MHFKSKEMLSQPFLIGLVAVGAYLGITAFLQEVNLDQLVFPAYITDPSVGIHADRARGPFVEAAANGLVYVGSDDGYLYALDASTGALLWSYLTDNTIRSCASEIQISSYFNPAYLRGTLSR